MAELLQGASTWCPSCQEAGLREIRQEDGWNPPSESGILRRFAGYKLSETTLQAEGEGLVAFMARVKRVGRLGVSRGNQQVVSRLLSWVHRPAARPWLWLRGGVGRGKTIHLSALGQELLEAGEDPFYCRERDLFVRVAHERHLAEADGGCLRRAMHCGVLLLDDASPEPHRREPPRPWMTRAMSGLVDARYGSDRATVFASTGDMLEYASLWEAGEEDTWLSGRLLEMTGGKEIVLQGWDWRRPRETDPEE